MLKSFNFLFLILSFLCSSGQSQSDLNYMAKVDSLVAVHLKMNKKNHLIYAVHNKVLVVDKNESQIYFLNFIDGYLKRRPMHRDSVDYFFKKANRRTGKRFSENEFEKSCIGSYLYLSINKASKRKYFFNLPYILLCNKKNVLYPFDNKVLNSLNALLLYSH